MCSFAGAAGSDDKARASWPWVSRRCLWPGMALNFGMDFLLKPAAPINPRQARVGVLLLLLGSAVLVVLAADAMPGAYSWKSHAISESAAQGQQHAWLGRLAFLCFGGAVLLLGLAARAEWGRGAYWCHLLFAGSMFGTAAFSHKPWEAGVPFDAFEDLLHSITATLMGFAFVAGVALRFLQRAPPSKAMRGLDILAFLCGSLLSPLGVAFPETGGVLQRAMFAVAYFWYRAEALALGRATRFSGIASGSHDGTA